jgi:DNA invertase Pin-like site-specific DNA recombinase
LQIKSAGYSVDEHFEDVGTSGTVEAMKRSGFKRMMEKVKQGDTIIAVEISRLGRDTIDVLNITVKLKEMGIRLVILQLGSIDLTSGFGEMLTTIMAAFAKLERSMLIDRINAGLDRAREEGKTLGRKPKDICRKSIDRLIASGYNKQQVANELKVSLRTIQRITNSREVGV